MFRRRRATTAAAGEPRSLFSPRTQAAVASAIAIPPPAEAQAAYTLGSALQNKHKNQKRRSRPMKRATSHWKAAAALGHVDATHALGLEALESRRLALASAYLTKAADAGHTDSCYLVGRMWLHGEGIERDTQRGVEYLKRAAEKQYAKANRALGEFYAHDADAKNQTKALDYYTAAVEEGDATAHCELGDLYHAMEQPEQAVQQYGLAVKRGDRHAMVRLAMCHIHGWGLSVPNPRRAAELLRQAGDQYAFQANYDIAQRFEKGDGVSRDPSTAVAFYQFAWEAAVEEGVDLEAIHVTETALLRLQAPFDPKSGRVKNCVFRWVHHLSAL